MFTLSISHKWMMYSQEKAKPILNTEAYITHCDWC